MTEDLLLPEQCKTDQSKVKNSFFVKTVIEWNHLETAVMHAETDEGFKTLLSKRDLISLPVHYSERPCTVQKQKKQKITV